MRGTKTCEGRHQIDLLIATELCRYGTGLRNILEETQPVAQPFERGTGGEDRTLDCVDGAPARPVRHGGQRPFCRRHCLLAGVEQEKTSRAVSRFGHAGVEAGLADQGGMLVARHARDRNRLIENTGRGDAIQKAVVVNLGKKSLGYIEHFQKIAVPTLAVDVVEHGSRGVGCVGRMHRAPGQVPEQETVDGAEGKFAAFGARPRARNVIENQASFVAEK